MFLKSALDKVKQIFNFLGVSALGSLKQTALNYLKRRSKKIVWCQKKGKKKDRGAHKSSNYIRRRADI